MERVSVNELVPHIHPAKVMLYLHCGQTLQSIYRSQFSAPQHSTALCSSHAPRALLEHHIGFLVSPALPFRHALRRASSQLSRKSQIRMLCSSVYRQAHHASEPNSFCKSSFWFHCCRPRPVHKFAAVSNLSKLGILRARLAFCSFAARTCRPVHFTDCRRRTAAWPAQSRGGFGRRHGCSCTASQSRCQRCRVGPLSVILPRDAAASKGLFFP